LLAGAALLAAFVWHEHRSSTAMMPLALFRSRQFSGINLVTLLLYGALGGALFFVPFVLIQAREYSAAAAGAAFLPFTLVLGVLSRWSGKLVDRYGARRPLMTGPAVVGVGFLLLSRPATSDSYWMLIVAMLVLGFGMAVTVAPLTTTVMNAVPADRTGIASGINNAVASIASLLLIAILGTVALDKYGRSLDRQLAAQRVAPEVRGAVDETRRALIVTPTRASTPRELRTAVHAIVARGTVEMFQDVLTIAALLAFASAALAAITISDGRDPTPGRAHRLT
jgi:MFS family permease